MTEFSVSEISEMREKFRPSAFQDEMVGLYESMIRIGRTGTEAFVTTSETYGTAELVAALHDTASFVSFEQIMVNRDLWKSRG